MPRKKNWWQTKLGSVVTFTNGGAWNASEYADSGIPVVRVTDCQNGTIYSSACKYLPKTAYAKYRKHELIEGDLIIATVGSHPTQPGSVVGRPIIVPREASGSLLNQNAVCIRPIDNSILDKHFLGHYAKAPSFGEYIIACARGSANQVRMAIGLLKEMPIEIPPLLTQRTIASILSGYDNLIENNLRRIKILEEVAQNLYREWFVKFRFPGHEQAHFVDSLLGRIPEGWEVVGVMENKNWSFIHQNIRPYEGKKRYFATADIDGIAITGDGIEYSYDQKPSRAQKQPLLNSVWFARMQETYKVLAVAQPNAILTMNSMLSSGFSGLMAPDEDSFAFLFLTIKSKEFHSEKDRFCTGATQRSLTNEGLSSILSISPPRVLVQQFGRVSMSFIELILTLQLRNQTLRSTRDLLLTKLISGELDVSEMDIVESEEGTQ
jgi:type I restriction enzyme, S subunit